MSNPGDDLIDNIVFLEKLVTKLQNSLYAKNAKITALKRHINIQDQAISRYARIEIDLHNAIAHVKQLASENNLLRKSEKKLLKEAVDNGKL